MLKTYVANLELVEFPGSVMSQCSIVLYESQIILVCLLFQKDLNFIGSSWKVSWCQKRT